MAYIECNNPAHPVTRHIAGSDAARECQAGASVQTPKRPLMGLPVAAVNHVFGQPDEPSPERLQLMRSPEVTLRPRGLGTHVSAHFVIDGKLDEEEALTAAEDSFHLEDAGVDVRRGEDGHWDVTASYGYKGTPDQADRHFRNDAWAGTPRTRNGIEEARAYALQDAIEERDLAQREVVRSVDGTLAQAQRAYNYSTSTGEGKRDAEDQYVHVLGGALAEEGWRMPNGDSDRPKRALRQFIASVTDGGQNRGFGGEELTRRLTERGATRD